MQFTKRNATLASGAVLAALVAAPLSADAQGWFGTSPQPQAVPQASAADAEIAELSLRVDRLEELIRRLNGEIEELRFRLDGGARPQPQVIPPAADARRPQPTEAPAQIAEIPAPAAVQPAPPPQPAPPQTVLPRPAPPPAAATLAAPGEGAPPDPSGEPTSLLPPSPYLPDGAEALGAPPSTLGTVPESALRGTQDTLAAVPPVRPPVEAEPLPPPDDAAEAAYNDAYGYLLQQDFAGAEAAFSEFLRRYPDHQLAGNAQYWLAETFYARGEYRRAAQGFLAGYRTYSASSKAPDSLLKLGMTLAALGQTDEACASFAEVARKFPQSDPAVRERAAAERENAGC